MNSAPSSVSRFISGVAAARASAASIVVPKLGNAIDIHIGLRNIGARARADDVRLHVAAHARHRMCQRAVDFQPVLHELLVGSPGLAGQQADDFDHAA